MSATSSADCRDGPHPRPHCGVDHLPDQYRDVATSASHRVLEAGLISVTAPSSFARIDAFLVEIEAGDLVAATPARSPTEPPMRPVPTTAARTGRYSGKSSRSDRAFEVHVVQRRALLLAVEVHHHPDAQRLAVRDPELAGTDQRDIAEPERARRRRRELGGDVVGRGEEDADQVVVGDVVAVEHLLHERLGLQLDLGFRVLVDGCRAAQRQDSHGPRG